jgi:hypothetical protein
MILHLRRIVPAEYPAGTVQVDVMIVYTPAARVVEGGTNGINNTINLAMEKSKEAHLNSDTRIYLNLVHRAETTYTESGDPYLDLDRLTYAGGSYTDMDDVHTWRDTYNADFICLLEDDPGTGGLGWVLNQETGKPSKAFCLAKVQQSDTSYTVVHEWGHNMGCRHSATQTSSPGPGLFSYSSGWQWDDTSANSVWPYTQQGYCSIMTYTDFDDDGTQEYEEVPYFSNPDIDYTGDSTNPVGHATNGDNARTMREMRHILSDYRIPLTPISSFPYTNSFEEGFGEWRFYDGTANWELENGSDVNLQNYPDMATTNAADGDIYLIVPGSGNSNKTAFLEAIFDFSALSNPEFSFSYCMNDYYGKEAVETLQVSTNSGSSWVDLWSNSGSSGQTWYQEEIDLSAYVGLTNVHLRFKGDLGPTWYKNYICLDAFSVTGVVANADSDGDGLPDNWETQYYGGATNANPSAMASNGVNTVMEAYIAGFDPTDADAGFLLTGLDLGRVMNWTWASGRVYSVYWSSNLVSGFDPVPMASNLTGSSFTDAVHSSESEGFYRIKVELAP